MKTINSFFVIGFLTVSMALTGCGADSADGSNDSESANDTNGNNDSSGNNDTGGNNDAGNNNDTSGNNDTGGSNDTGNSNDTSGNDGSGTDTTPNADSYPAFSGSLTFTNTGAEAVPNGSTSFTFTPDAVMGNFLAPSFSSGKAEDNNNISVLVSKRGGETGVGQIQVNSGHTSFKHTWNLQNHQGAIDGVTASLEGDTVSYTFDSVDVPEFATGSTTLTIDGTVKIDINPNPSQSPPDLGTLNITSSDDSSLNGAQFKPVVVNQQYGTITWSYQPEQGSMQTLSIMESLSYITGLARYTNGDLSGSNPTFSAGPNATGLTFGTDSVTFDNVEIQSVDSSSGSVVITKATLNGTLTRPSADGEIR